MATFSSYLQSDGFKQLWTPGMEDWFAVSLRDEVENYPQRGNWILESSRLSIPVRRLTNALPERRPERMRLKLHVAAARNFSSRDRVTRIRWTSNSGSDVILASIGMGIG
ncbi:MAG: hypothetical protein FJ267_09520 [Planctomycetes bacterium]|nr:hypothetical protein [Planctomycetota bacterium]